MPLTYPEFCKTASYEIQICHARKLAYTKLLNVQQELRAIYETDVLLQSSYIEGLIGDDRIPYQDKLDQAFEDIQLTGNEITDCQNKLQVIQQNQEYQTWVQLLNAAFPPETVHFSGSFLIQQP